MIRFSCIGSVLTLMLVCGASSHDSRSIASNDPYHNGEDIRLDAIGNETHGPRIGDRSPAGFADGDRGEYPGSRYGSESSTSSSSNWNDGSAHTASAGASHGSQGNRADFNPASWGDSAWNDSDLVMVNESEIPSGARSCLSREAGGGALFEADRGMGAVKQAYCARFIKYGHACRPISDNDTNLNGMRRVA